jgi:hypothetical protein
MLLDFLETILYNEGKMFARTDAVGVVDDSSDEALLAEVYGNVVESYQKKSGVARVKAQGLGDPAAGSMVFSRFQNASVKTYGTARTAGAGDDVIDDQTTVNLSTHKEIVEELEMFDVKHYGVGNLMQRRGPNHALRMLAHLDRAALTAAKTAAAAESNNTDVTYPNGTTPDYLDLLEQVALKVETVSNDYVDGVDRDMIVVFLKPSIYSKVQSALDKVYAYTGNSEMVEVPGYHGFQVISSHYLPSDTDFIATTVGNIAQPVFSEGYIDGGRIKLSNAYEVSMFFDYGTEILASDLVFEGEFAEASAT